MIDMPAFVVYVGTVSLVIVCVFLTVLLFYLILLVRTARAFLAYVETQARRTRARLSAAHDLFALAKDFLAGWADYEH